MAYRQPFRSGLRELAESLLRRAQTERAYSQVEQQLELQKGEIGANLAQNLTQNVQQGIAGIFAQPEQTYDTGAIRDTISDEISQLQGAITQMQARGASSEEIADYQRLLADKQTLLTLPDSRLPQAYEQTVTGFLVPPTPSQINAVPGTLPGQTRLPDPGLPGTGQTGADVLSRALAGGASAEIATQTDQQIVANLLPKLTFNPDEPASVVQAYMALDQVNALPLPIRNQLAEQANAVRRAAQSPEAKSLIEAELARRRTDDQIAEGELAQQDIDLQRSKADLAYALRTLNPRVQQTIRALDDAKQDRIAQALSTGVYAGLDEDEQKYLATIVGVEPDGLEEWAAGQVARKERMDALDEQRAELVNQQAGLNITIAGLDISEAVAEYAQNVWRMSEERRVAEHQAWLDERERGFAPMQDERTVSEMISGAITNNDAALLNHYIYAIQEGTPLGIQLQTFGGPDLLNQLTDAKAVATEMQALEMAELRDNDQLRDLTIQDARARLDAFKESSPLELERLRLQVAQGRTDLSASELALLEDRARFRLLPLELEALRMEYERDIAMAERDIRALPLEEAGETLATLGEIARAVPPGSEFWDNPPDYLTRSLEKTGLSLDIFKGISIFEEWLRQEPIREEAWRELETLMQSPPMDDAARTNMMASVEDLAWKLGMDEMQRAGLMSAVASIWNESDVVLRQRLLQMATSALTGEDPVDIARALNGMSSLSTSLRQQYETVEPRRIIDMGCATMPQVDLSMFAQPMQFNWKPNLAGIEVGNGQTCYDVQVAYNALGARIQNVNNTQERLANMLSSAVGGGTVSQSNSDGTATGNGTPAPSPRGDVDWGSYGVIPVDIAKFNEVVRLFNEGNQEGFNAIFGELVGAYDIDKVREILGQLGVRWAGQ